MAPSRPCQEQGTQTQASRRDLPSPRRSGVGQAGASRLKGQVGKPDSNPATRRVYHNPQASASATSALLKRPISRDFLPLPAGIRTLPRDSLAAICSQEALKSSRTKALKHRKRRLVICASPPQPPYLQASGDGPGWGGTNPHPPVWVSSARGRAGCGAPSPSPSPAVGGGSPGASESLGSEPSALHTSAGAGAGNEARSPQASAHCPRGAAQASADGLRSPRLQEARKADSAAGRAVYLAGVNLQLIQNPLSKIEATWGKFSISVEDCSSPA
ncbi:uncharacterized protein LOC125080556 [Lutra lutra]|uniref:uncharacterized protein LOC125080556 n=1 Tax=Lutra lutra TaxID=9657 RepID=UPI001FD62A15|nr:uncharacterized protein LOC125080556 [Lutra lutra]